MSVRVITGDCREVMPGMEANSVDAIVTDPPAGINFMGKAWDHDKGGRDQWIAWMQSVAAECLRVLKPGGHALVWALPRTSHWTATAWENAGFTVRDRCIHIFSQGFPKSLDVSKAIDRAAGAERKLTRAGTTQRDGYGDDWDTGSSGSRPRFDEPVTDAARQWQGWGTALKPAAEDWWLLRKPFPNGYTVAQNVLEFGTGGLNIDACRVDIDPCERDALDNRSGAGFGTGNTVGVHQGREEGVFKSHALGRWPSHLVHDGSDEVLAAFPQARSSGQYESKDNGRPFDRVTDFGGKGIPSTMYSDTGSAARFFYTAKASSFDRNDGVREIQTWESADLSQLEEALSQVQKGTSDALTLLQGEPSWSIASSGSEPTDQYLRAIRSIIETESRRTTDSKTSRSSASWNTSESIRAAFVTARASGSSLAELAEYISRCQAATTCGPMESALSAAHALFVGLSEASKSGRRGNIHSTVKPTELMRWLCRLITPPGGTILDPFCGSGSTLKAAEIEGFSAIGIEFDPAYVEIARRRIASDIPLFAEIAALTEEALSNSASETLWCSPHCVPERVSQFDLFAEVAA